MNQLTQSQAQQAAKNLPESAIGCAAIVLGTALAKPSRAIYVGTAGSVILTFTDGTHATFTDLPAGLYPFSIVLAATTTGPASNLVALF